MSATFELDTRGFRRALAGLSAFSGQSISQVIRAEAGSILKACAGDTDVTTVAKARDRARVRSIRELELTGAHGVSINAGVKKSKEYGRVFLRTSTGKWRRTHEANFKPVAGLEGSGARRKRGDHYFDFDWLTITDAITQAKAAIAKAVPAAIRAIGLARQSWVQIADDLGIPLESVPGGRLSAAGIAKARAAIASTGRAYRNGVGEEERRARDFFVVIRNRLPYGRQIQLDRILVKNVQGRVRFFEQNLARGTFDQLARIARAYPGLDVRRN